MNNGILRWLGHQDVQPGVYAEGRELARGPRFHPRLERDGRWQYTCTIAVGGVSSVCSDLPEAVARAALKVPNKREKP